MPRSAVGGAPRGPGFNTRSGHIYFRSPSADIRGTVISYWQKYVHEVLVNRLGGLSLIRKSVATQHDTLDVYRGRKTTNKQHHLRKLSSFWKVIT